MPMNLSISLWNYIHYFPLRKGGTSFFLDGGLDSLARVIDEIATAGYGVELWPHWSSWEWTSPEREALESQPFDLFAEEHRPQLVQILSGVRSSWHTGGGKNLENYRRQIDTVAQVGSRVLVMHAANLSLDGPDPDFDFAAQVLDYARQHEVRIALENASEGEQDEDPALWNLPILERAIARFDDLVICLDTTHVEKFKRFSLAEYVDRLKDHIAHLHISDALGDNIGIGRLHTVPGTGKIPEADWRYLLDALEEIDFQGDAVLEIKPLTPVRIAQEADEFFARVAR
jgi:sugar phosphate isomerase/epimerase